MSLAVERVSMTFARRARPGEPATTQAVRRVSLELGAAETLGLVGESGSGKSTLARIVLGLLHPSDGHVLFDGVRLDSFSRQQYANFRRQVQAVFQDPRSSLNWRLSIEKIVTEPLRNYGVGDRRQRHDKAVELLEQVHVSPHLLTRRPPELSGGQLQRVAIARALALEPSYLVCDEPLSALDVSVQAGVVNLLLDLQQSRGLSMLFISHDLGVVRHLSDRVLVMYRGEVVEGASAADLYRNPSHPYTRSLLGLTGDDAPPSDAPPSDGGDLVGAAAGAEREPPEAEPCGGPTVPVVTDEMEERIGN